MYQKIKTLYDLAVESGKIKPEIVPHDQFISLPNLMKHKLGIRYNKSAAAARRLRYEREEKEQQRLSDKIINSKRHQHD